MKLHGNKDFIPKKEYIKLTTLDKTYYQVYCFEDVVIANNYGNNYLKSFHWDKKEV